MRAHRFIDITGQHFNRWLVLEFAYIKNGCAYWKCICDCGTTKTVCGANLRNNGSKSCGCLNRERVSEVSRGKFIDLTGQRFERYFVLEFDSIKSRHTYFKCLCDCGVVKVVSSDNLGSGHTRSCGCLSREKTFERNYNPNLTDEEREDKRKYPEYYEWRRAVYERDNYTCQCCGDNKGGNLCAHHLESYRDNPELRTTLENGITLCEECHKNFHHQYGKGRNTREQFEEFLVWMCKGETT